MQYVVSLMPFVIRQKIRIARINSDVRLHCKRDPIERKRRANSVRISKKMLIILKLSRYFFLVLSKRTRNVKALLLLPFFWQTSEKSEQKSCIRMETKRFDSVEIWRFSKLNRFQVQWEFAALSSAFSPSLCARIALYLTPVIQFDT